MPGKGKDGEEKPVKGTTEKVAKKKRPKNPPGNGKLLFCKNSASLKIPSGRSHTLRLCSVQNEIHIKTWGR